MSDRGNYTTYNIKYRVVYERLFVATGLGEEGLNQRGYRLRPFLVIEEGLWDSRTEMAEGLHANDNAIAIDGPDWETVLAKERQ